MRLPQLVLIRQPQNNVLTYLGNYSFGSSLTQTQTNGNSYLYHVLFLSVSDLDVSTHY